jgi:hypothetical protein
MMDAHKSDAADLGPKAESPVDLVRIATYVEDLDRAVRLENEARAKGRQLQPRTAPGLPEAAGV